MALSCRHEIRPLVVSTRVPPGGQRRIRTLFRYWWETEHRRPVGPVTETRRADPLPSPSWGSEARALEGMEQGRFPEEMVPQNLGVQTWPLLLKRCRCRCQ